MNGLSILIPTYNDVCAGLVADLHRQAVACGTDYEIVVADDGSTDADVMSQNRAVNALPHCRCMERGENSGRAAIRNFLARQARYEWLLFIDGDMVVRHDDYLQNYIAAAGIGLQNDAPAADGGQPDVVYGGLTIGPLTDGNLRSMYEHAAAPHHTLAHRQAAPYHDFHTANFMIRRELMLSHPFDSRFRYYGYEDVLFGKQLKEHGIGIMHIDNALSFERFESNRHFMDKTEEGLRTLYHFRDELHGYSRLLEPFSTWYAPLLTTLFGGLYTMLAAPVRRNLAGEHPKLWLFQYYKMGYMAWLHQHRAT